ncbi:MAG: FIST N-terminal domain-containing protein [Actinomycetota bacterium]
MRTGCGLSTLEESSAAGRQAATRAMEVLGGGQPDLALMFFSAHHMSSIDSLLAPILAELGPGALIGCSSQAVIGEGREIEQGPAISLFAVSLDMGASVETFHVRVEDVADGRALVGFPLFAQTATAVVLLADPFTFPADALLKTLNQDHPGLPVTGGMAGGGDGHSMLVVGNQVVDRGAVGFLLKGVPVTALVSQGCRPIGKPFVITEAEDTLITGLAGEPPLRRLQQVVSKLSPEDQQLVSNGLHLGLVINEATVDPSSGDFLIRAIMNANTQTGAIVAGDRVSVGQTVQFQLRDAASADAELRTMLELSPAASGALVFSCNGRGVGMFDVPDHDAQAITDVCGTIPTAGMFCNGEFGAIGGKNFIHGFTASLALFQD